MIATSPPHKTLPLEPLIDEEKQSVFSTFSALLSAPGLQNVGNPANQAYLPDKQ